MKTIRNNTNLTALSNTQLNNIVTNCLAKGVDEASFKAQLPEWKALIGARMEVAAASLAFDMLTSLKTCVHTQAASSESKLWSNMEGGHIHHEVPKINVMDLT